MHIDTFSKLSVFAWGYMIGKGSGTAPLLLLEWLLPNML